MPSVIVQNPDRSGQLQGVQQEEILASTFTFSGGLSTATVSATPDTDPDVVMFQLLFKSGAAVQSRVVGAPSQEGEWRLNGTTLEIFGDVRASGDTYKVLFASN